MKYNNTLFLPGTDEQLNIFLRSVNVKDKSVLVIGGGSEEIALTFHQRNAVEVYLITDDEDSLVQARYSLSGNKEINIRMMDYNNTDFTPERFNVVYSQGSTGTGKRNKIVKEFLRILKPGGYLCTGEFVNLAKTPPQFIQDIWDINNLSPLYHEDLKNYYMTKDFELIQENNLSGTLKEFYSTAELLIEKSSKETDSVGKQLKKLAKMYNHEAKSYLKLGGDKYIGYRMLILKLISNLKS